MREEAWQALKREYNMHFAPPPPDEVPETPEAESDDAIQESVHTERGGVTFIEPAVDLEQTPFETEVDIYQRELRAPSTLSNLEVLPWWQAQESRFPNLARMVRQFLACPASSASAERIFSLAGRLFDDKSQAMKEENIEDRMWAKQHVLNQRAKKL